MPLWAGLASALFSLILLALFLFRVRYRLEWNGGSEWSVEFGYGVPGFMSGHRFPDPAPAPSPKSGPASSQAGFLRIPRLFRFDRQRLRRALFHFATDTGVARALIGFGFRVQRAVFRLLNPRVDCALGNPDPVALGRMAAAWHGLAAFPGRDRVALGFRFQDRAASVRIHVEGGFSAARFLAFAGAVALAFPWATLLSGAWRSWRKPGLTGWRAFAYARIQAWA